VSALEAEQRVALSGGALAGLGDHAGGALQGDLVQTAELERDASPHDWPVESSVTRMSSRASQHSST